MSNAELSTRLVAIHDGLVSVVEDYAPDEAAVEATFVNRDGAADVPIFLIGAPFWGILFGLAASWLRERHDMKPAPATETPRQTAAGSQEPTAR